MEGSQKTISSIIMDAMESKGLNMEKLSEETGISDRFIELLLSEQFDDMPPAPYTHGYIIKIADVLDLDGEKIWDTYLKNSKSIRRSGEFDKLPQNRFSTPGINKKVVLIISIFVIIAGYFVLRTAFSSDISDELRLNNIEENPTVVSESEFTIEGSLDPQYQLTVNQTPVYPDGSGNFEENITLEEGLNTIIFNIEGALGKEGEVTRQILYRSDETSTSTEDEINTNTSTPING